MATVAKTIVATGVTSGLGFEAVKQLLQQTQPYRIILGARNTTTTTSAFDALDFDRAANPVTILPLDLSDVRTVKSFAQQAQEKLGQDKIDYVLLNAAISKDATQPAPHGEKWCEAAVVNHNAQHYLIHLLRKKLVDSKARIVFVSSGAIRMVSDTSTLEATLKNNSTATFREIYGGSKFIQLLGAHWWRRELKGSCDVVAVSPGLIPDTGLGRYTGFSIPRDNPDAKSIDTGAQSILAALTRDDFPEDPDRIFLTSWGDWWPRDSIEKSCDKDLQDKWAFTQEEIEKDSGVV